MSQIFDSIFEYLFKYPLVAYERGDIVWSGSWSLLLLLPLVLLGGGLVAWSYRRNRGVASVRTLWALAAIRTLGFAIILICLLRPTLVVSTAVPRENVVAVLVDDSRSMEIADIDDQPRGFLAREAFISEESALLGELRERFMVRHFRFSSGAERLRSSGDLTFQGHRTLLGPALDFARQELSALPLAGLVLVTDGGDHDSEALDDALLGLRAEGIPVYVVGTGLEKIVPDIQVDRVEVPQSVTRGSTMMASAVIAHAGVNSRRITVNVEEDGRILATQEVQLAGADGNSSVQIPVTLPDAGMRALRVRVPVQDGEIITENNHADAFVRVRDGREKILYFEGQPRYDVAFMRRAIAPDENLQLVVLQRTGEDRYFRQDVDSGDELSGGFPQSREELFEYRGLIIGSVDAGTFTPDQLRMIGDFVDRRGGGVLFLGGPLALAEGGYATSALSSIIPVELETAPPVRAGQTRFWTRVKVAPTREGLTHPAVMLAPVTPDSDEDEALITPWEDLPELETVNALRAPRPGATVLLSGRSTELPRGEQAVLAFQRYGAGVSALLAVQDLWVWQMDYSISLEDQTHERFWRQLLRWLIQEVPDPLTANAVRNRVAPEEPVDLVANLVSEEYLPVNDARVIARVVDPVGGEREVTLTWNLSKDGEYLGTFTPEMTGPYEVEILASDGERQLVAPPIRIEAGVLDEEVRSGAMRGNLLRRIAMETGGDFFTLDNLDGLPEALQYSGRGTVIQEQLDLWDLPLFFFLLVGLLSAEWLLRRKGGLP